MAIPSQVKTKSESSNFRILRYPISVFNKNSTLKPVSLGYPLLVFSKKLYSQSNTKTKKPKISGTCRNRFCRRFRVFCLLSVKVCSWYKTHSKTLPVSGMYPFCQYQEFNLDLWQCRSKHFPGTRTGDWANTQPSCQGVSLFRAQSRLVLHESSKSLHGGDLRWSGGQLSPSLLALTWLAVQPVYPPLRSETHTQSWSWRLQWHDPNSQRILNSSISRFSSSQMRPTRVSLLRVFFFLLLLFFKKNKCCCD